MKTQVKNPVFADWRKQYAKLTLTRPFGCMQRRLWDVYPLGFLNVFLTFCTVMILYSVVMGEL